MSRLESTFLEWLRSQPRPGGVILGPGDDMAILDAHGGPDAHGGSLLMSSDMILEGVHFRLEETTLELVGRKAAAACLSDCAAMAVRPLAATMSIAWPRSMSLQDLQACWRGAAELCEAYDTALAGGDFTSWDHPLAIDVAVVATSADLRPVRRDGARVGDRLFVTGLLGGSLSGRHLRFPVRVREALALSRTLGERLGAMIDITDGLAIDASRIARASGTGIRFDRRALEAVASPDAHRAAAASGRRVVDHVLEDGEDFELLLAIRGDPADAGPDVHPVGEVTESGLTMCHDDGTIEDISAGGYVH